MHLLASASNQARFLPTTTTRSPALLIATIGVETLLDRGSRQLQDPLLHGHLQPDQRVGVAGVLESFCPQ